MGSNVKLILLTAVGVLVANFFLGSFGGGGN